MSNLTNAPVWRRIIAPTLLALCAFACASHSLAATLGSAAAAANKPAPSATKPVDINRASRTQLMKLPGIGRVEAVRIIAARPYRSKAELVSKQVLPEGVYLSLRHRIMAGQKVAT